MDLGEIGLDNISPHQQQPTEEMTAIEGMNVRLELDERVGLVTKSQAIKAANCHRQWACSFLGGEKKNCISRLIETKMKKGETTGNQI